MPISASYQPGASLKFNYSYKNETGKVIKVKVTRQLLNSKGKVVKTASANKSLKKGEVFIRKVSEAIASNLPAGEYTVKIKIAYLNNKLLAENSFKVSVEKLKKKYFTLGDASSADSNLSFDTASLKKVKSGVFLPANFKAKYVYTNTTNLKQIVKMERLLLNGDGKVLESKSGKWTLKAGEKDDLTFTQALSKLGAGDYKVVIKAKDNKTGVVLVENSLGFVVELK